MSLSYAIIIMMKALGFCVDWCPLTYRSMSSASLSIVLNGNVFDNFKASNDSRQCDSISLYPFSIIMQGLCVD